MLEALGGIKVASTQRQANHVFTTNIMIIDHDAGLAKNQ